jgi:hypothetical protein
MEHWVEIYKNIIPAGNYQSLVQNGEESGLLIKLENDDYIVNINFGIVSALRMLDEGIVLNSLFSDEEIMGYKNNNFSNVIYKIVDGELDNFIKKISNGQNDFYDLKHYIIITINYNIEVMSMWEPNIIVKEKLKVSFKI